MPNAALENERPCFSGRPCGAWSVATRSNNPCFSSSSSRRESPWVRSGGLTFVFGSATGMATTWLFDVYELPATANPVVGHR